MGLIDATITGRMVVGGLVGSNSLGAISECFVTGMVNGSGTVGLIAGGSTGTIRNCYARGDLTGTSYTGGFIGTVAQGVVECCYVVNSLSSPRSMGGFAAGLQAGTITGCFWDTTTSGIQTSAGGGGLSTSDLQILDTFSYNGWAGTAWVNEGHDYPRLAWEGTVGSPIGSPVIPLEGDGTEANPYTITSIENLRLLNKGVLLHIFM